MGITITASCPRCGEQKTFPKDCATHISLYVSLSDIIFDCEDGFIELGLGMEWLNLGYDYLCATCHKEVSSYIDTATREHTEKVKQHIMNYEQCDQKKPNN